MAIRFNVPYLGGNELKYLAEVIENRVFAGNGPFTDRVQIMYLGHVMEEGRAGDVFGAPRHPYTEALLSSIPPVDRDEERLKAIEGTVPMAYARPPGCPFEPRCGYARPECSSAIPPLVDLGAGHRAACIRNTGYAFAEAAR